MQNKLASANSEFQLTEDTFIKLQGTVSKTNKQRATLEKQLVMNVGSETKAVQYIREMSTLKKDIKRLKATQDMKGKEIKQLKNEGDYLLSESTRLDSQIKSVQHEIINLRGEYRDFNK